MATAKISTTTSDSDGGAVVFRFDSIVPGSYVVEGSSSRNLRRLEHASQPVTVRFGNVQLAQTIEIVAQSIVGSVFVAGKGAHATKEPVVVTLRNVDASAAAKPSVSKTDSLGAYQFENVPCGNYELSASAGEAETVPKSIAVTVDAASVGAIQVRIFVSYFFLVSFYI